MDTDEAHARLIRLQAERYEAVELGVANPSPYLARLDAAVAEARAEYMTSAVCEIAFLRRALARAAGD